VPRGVGLTREQVRTSALAVFATKGYGGASIGDVAATLGIAKASVYNWAPSKEALLATTVAPYLDDLAALTSGLDDTVTDDPAGLLRQFTSCLLKHQKIVEFVYRDVSVLNETGVGADLHRLGSRLVEVLAGPLPDEYLEDITVALGAMALAVCALDRPAPALRELLIQAGVAGFAVVRAQQGNTTTASDR
jgi:AcrR family transcriptional regulator